MAENASTKSSRPLTSVEHTGNGIFNVFHANKKAGTISVSKNGAGHFVSAANLDEPFIGKGVGHEAYNLIEQEIGRKLAPSPLGISQIATKFWQKRLKNASPEERQELFNTTRQAGTSYGLSPRDVNMRLYAIGGPESLPPVEGTPDITKKRGGTVKTKAVDVNHPNFRSWFGSSVAHDDGAPRRYFTGTSKDVDFPDFKVSRHGAWFTTDPKDASGYAEQNDSQNYRFEAGKVRKTNTASRVIPAYLKAENPYTGDKPDNIMQFENYKKAQSDWFDTLRAQGYDSWVPESQGGNLAVILGHSGQIKSAVSNTGDFDPNQKRIDRAYGGRNKERDNVWWHGSVSGDMRGGKSGLHLGTKAAAEDALHARIGFPAEGDWDGTREYGKTLLAGKKTILKRDKYGITGRNVHAPDEDYYAHEHPEGPLKHWNDEPVDPAVTPSIKPFRIVGKMTNTISNPHNDWKANGDMQAALKKGNAKNGYFYKNEGEDYESISAVVPNGSHVEPIEQDDITKADGGALTDDDGITAYHGSPHDFEQFDTSKIGTGEGNQSFGHGLYFAQNERVAKGYKNDLSPTLKASDAIDPLHRRIGQMALTFSDNTPEGAIAWLDKYKNGAGHTAPAMTADAVAAVKKHFESGEFSPGGHMYEVHINADPQKHFLDWDASLREQPEAIRRLAGWNAEDDAAYRSWFGQDAAGLAAELEGTGEYTPTKPPARPAGSLPMSMKGHELYEHLQNKLGAIDWPVDADADTRSKFRKTAAERVGNHLTENGIRGIRYLDAGSRGGDETPTRNYVVFNHDHVRVKRKYARGGTV